MTFFFKFRNIQNAPVLQLLVIVGSKLNAPWPISKLVSFLKIRVLLESVTHAHILRCSDTMDANLVAMEVMKAEISSLSIFHSQLMTLQSVSRNSGR